MKKIIDLVGNKSLLIHYLKMLLKGSQKKIHKHNHNLKILSHSLQFKHNLNNYINKHHSLYKILHNIKINKLLKIKILQNNNKLLCINNKFNKFSHKLNLFNSYNNR